NAAMSEVSFHDPDILAEAGRRRPRGEGAWLPGDDGRRILDAAGSGGSCLHGHAEPRIAEAVARQARRLERGGPDGAGREAEDTLAGRLLALAPRQPGRPRLAALRYADSGPAALGLALGMARKWFHALGDEPRRTKSVALAGSWRGARPDAATPVGAPRDARIAAPPPEPMLAPSPDAWDARPGQTAADCAEEAADAPARLLDEHPGEAFALVLEPRLQCAAGMRMHHPVYLRRA